MSVLCDKQKTVDALARLTTLGIQTLRIMGEYQSAEVRNGTNELALMIDGQLYKMLKNVVNDPIAKYHYFSRWRERCFITNKYRKLSFLRSNTIQR